MSQPSYDEQAEELTAAALEALSLVEHVPLHTHPAHPTPPVTHLEYLPANIPLPPTPHPRADHAQRLLRHIMSIFHAAHHQNDIPLLVRAVATVNALALASAAYRRLLAHLGVIRLLPPAFASLAAADHPAASLVIQALAACLKGADGLAVAHFAASKASRHLLAAWRGLSPAACTSRLLVPICDSFAECLPRLPPTALDALAAPDVLVLLRDALDSAVVAADARLAAAALAVLTGVVVHATDGVGPDAESTRAPPEPAFPHLVRRSVVQARVRELCLLRSALLALRDMRRHAPVALAALKFLSAAVQDNVQNIVELAAVREAHALQLVLRCAGEMAGPVGFQMEVSERGKFGGPPDERTAEILCTVCDLVVDICVVKVNFDTLLTYGLTGKLVELLRGISSSVSHVKKGLELLDKCVRSSETESRKAYAECAAASVVAAMHAYRHKSSIQAVSIHVLISLIEMHDQNRGSVCSVHAIQAVHFAMTEHSKDGTVIAICCEFLLLLSPSDIMSTRLQLSELKKLVKSRSKMHKDARNVSATIDDLALALDLIPQKTVRGIEDSMMAGTGESNGTCSAGHSSGKRLLSARTSGPSSFRKSFHRKARQTRRTGADSQRRRRARSDFAAETTFERNRSQGLKRFEQEGAHSFRLRGSRLAEKSVAALKDCSTLDSTANSINSSQSDDQKAFDPLGETLARHRAYRDETSSHSSQSSRVLTSRNTLPNESRLTLPALKTSGKPPIHGEAKDLRSSKEWSSSLGLSRKENKLVNTGLLTVVEKRSGPNLRSRRRPESLNESQLNIEMNGTEGKRNGMHDDRDSLLSFSDSEFDSCSDDDSWIHNEGFTDSNAQGRPRVDHREGEYEAVVGRQNSDEMDDFEGTTLSGEQDGSLEAISPIVNMLRGLSMADAKVLTQEFDPDDELADGDEGNTNSTGSHHVSMLTESFSNGNGFHEADEELAPQFPKFGERERVRGDVLRTSTNWGPPKESIWPLIPIDNAAEVHRSSPLPRMPARGESGSLAYSGVRPQTSS